MNQISVGFPRNAVTVSVLPARVVKVPFGAVVPIGSDTPDGVLPGAEPELLFAT